MNEKTLKVLIIEDTPERQKILKNLYKDHAWILVNNAARAKRLLGFYDFDLISLDYDLAGEEKGDQVAIFINKSRNSGAKVLVHSMNANGAQLISDILPDAICVPLSKIIRTNETFKRLRNQLRQGLDIDWNYIFRKDSLSNTSRKNKSDANE